MVYLITHGERYFGLDPSLNEKGIEQVSELCQKVPKNISIVVIGTGKRFYQIYCILKTRLMEKPIKFSPFCGSADGLEADGKIITVENNTVVQDDYIGLIGNDCFDAWKFISSLPNNALLCSGGELLIALGLKNIREKGQIYELDPKTQTGRKI